MSRVMQDLYAAGGQPDEPHMGGDPKLSRKIAVIGGGIAGLSCAWALGGRHAVTLFEREHRLGGHSNTVVIPGADGSPLAVDTGFIVYNEPAYPNLTALFAHLGVKTLASDMSFAVSRDGGRLEYGTTTVPALFGQRRNAVSPRFWRMLRELLRFYRLAPETLDAIDDTLSLGDWLDRHGPFDTMTADHLVPMAAAIWSCPAAEVRDYPASAFIRFCRNHGLLQVSNRPVWRTVHGGAQSYVARLREAFAGTIRLESRVRAVTPTTAGVQVTAEDGAAQHFDAVVLACHAPEARALLPADIAVRLASFATTTNVAVLHGDPSLMPRRRRVWASWNVLDSSAVTADPPCVTYWMNRLQHLPGRDLFVTLNPPRAPAGILRTETYAHPAYNQATLQAQRAVWRRQGEDGIWFAGAWLGAGFHEDGLQAGLAVAEALGAPARPWQVADPSGRMPGPLVPAPATSLLAA